MTTPAPQTHDWVELESIQARDSGEGTLPPGEVRVVLAVLNGQAVIVVEDNGCGFDPGVISIYCAYAQERLFDEIHAVEATGS